MARGTTTERGYDGAWKKKRLEWKRLVDAGHGVCCEPICLKFSRYINPAEPWDLAHTDDGTAIKGVSHRACNRGDGGRRSWGRGIAASRTGRRPASSGRAPRWRPTRIW